MKNLQLIGMLLFCLAVGQQAGAQVPVDWVPSAFPVNFSIVTKGDNQYVAYYDTAHVMTVARRTLDGKEWERKRLDSKVGWDSHNYIAMFIDSLGYIHISGNMHSDSLKYFRSSKPWDIQTIEREQMVGSEEDLTTYPVFMKGPGNQVIFHYRYGRSGNGYEVYNVLDRQSGQWKRLLSKPLIDGRGEMNAYMEGPVMGPDGYYHLIWVWRNTPDCSTNHTLSYARSKDLLHWESVRGEAVELPITLADTVLVVDPVQPQGGLINIGIKIGFDSQGRPVIGYHKYDVAGNTQLMLARYENEVWKRRQITSWNFRWDFKGMGTIVNELLIEAPEIWGEGRMRMGYRLLNMPPGQVVVDERIFKPMYENEFVVDYPLVVDKVESMLPWMQANKIREAGNPEYMLRWESLPPYRDQAPLYQLEPSLLTVWQIDTSESRVVDQYVDVKPRFPEGSPAEWVARNLVYPLKAKKAKKEGKIFVQFFIAEDGKLSNVKVVGDSRNYLFNAEAVRVVSSMPAWIPAEKKGKKVRVSYTMPVNFKLSK